MSVRDNVSEKEMCVLDHPTEAWLLAGAVTVAPRDVEQFRLQFRHFGLEEVTLDELARVERANHMADALVACRRLPSHVVPLTPVVRQIAEFI